MATAITQVCGCSCGFTSDQAAHLINSEGAFFDRVERWAEFEKTLQWSNGSTTCVKSTKVVLSSEPVTCRKLACVSWQYMMGAGMQHRILRAQLEGPMHPNSHSSFYVYACFDLHVARVSWMVLDTCRLSKCYMGRTRESLTELSAC